jgi:hypothetical protein
MSNLIDTNFDFSSDTPIGKDPDSYSPTLRRYHKILWSKPLPNGLRFDLTDTTRKVYLHHQSELGEFSLSSDAIAHSYSRLKSMLHIINQVPSNEVDSFHAICRTIGGYMVFPSNRIDNKMTINGSRGFNRNIRDRFDLTLECIRRYYLNEGSPLSATLQKYSSFFGLFKDFQGYVDFFLLQDLVTEDYLSIKFCLPFDSFHNPPLPTNVHEYLSYKNNMTDFVLARNQRLCT